MDTPAAVVVSAEDWTSLDETLEILSDSNTMAALRHAGEGIARGDVNPTDELLAACGRRRAGRLGMPAPADGS